MYVINTLAPVFLVIALGAALRAIRFFDDDLIRGVNRLAYWVGLPCLLFYKTANAPSIDGASANAFLIILAGTVVCIAVAYVASFAFRMSGPQTGSFVQAALRGNLAFIGLGIVFNAFSGRFDGATAEAAERIAVLALAPMVVIYNVLSVIILLASQHKMSLSAVRKIARGMITNPLLISCAGGILFSMAGMELPQFADTSINVIGQFGLPAALLGIGGTLVSARIKGRIGFSVMAASIKTIIAPLVGWVVAGWLGASSQETAVAIILLACPTAISSYVLADQLGADSTLSASAIVISTLFSAVTLGVAVTMI